MLLVLLDTDNISPEEKTPLMLQSWLMVGPRLKFTGPAPQFRPLSRGLHTSTSLILTRPSLALPTAASPVQPLWSCQGTMGGHQVRGFCQPDLRVLQLSESPSGCVLWI